MSLGNVKVGDIVPGKIVRITDYGAFCELAVDERGYYNRPIRGLIHISQLATARVENVEDVVRNDDSVWVKILDISEYDEDTPSSSSADRRHPSHHNRRHKVSLSLKDASQDGLRRDLAEEETNEKHQRLKTSTQMESNLNSTIGMGLARDPMDPMAQRILLKQDKKRGTGALIINGYSLVDDTEGEPLPPPMTEQDASTRKKKSAVDTTGVGSVRVPPMGRGRGLTLPAWMTQPNAASAADGGGEGPTGIRMSRERQANGTMSDEEDHHSRHRRREKKKRKDHKRKEKKHKSSSTRDRHRPHHRRHKHSKHDRRKERRKERDEWSDGSSRSSWSRRSDSDDSVNTERDRTTSRPAVESSSGNNRDRKRSLSPNRAYSKHGANDENNLDKQRGTSTGDSKPPSAKAARYDSSDQSVSTCGPRDGYDRNMGDSKRRKSRKRYKRGSPMKDERKRGRRHQRSRSYSYEGRMSK